MSRARSVPTGREDLAARRRRARAILTRLAKAYPDWGPTLEFSSPFELLVATILAAQAQDERVNQVTRELFAKYRGPADYLKVPVAELERDVHATGFFRMKAKAIRGSSEQLLAEFGGEVPGDMDSLVRLRGVGRKTASIVLGNAFGVPAIAVDRHVLRVATRLRLTRPRQPDGIEEGLKALYPRKDWVKATWNLVLHGRRICTPTPKCPICPVIDLCPYPKKTTAARTSRPVPQRRSPARLSR
ncbi:MAG TPA: endonuclease III [Candidatus Limnocylindria bacterium]|nr:endonuclease III [Candidatus Limnocylindria bacterium]